MSDVEDIIERIKCQSGVEGYIICSQKGEIIRQSYYLNDEKYANKIVPLCLQARELCRDLNPKNELKIIRLQTKGHEIIASHDLDFVVIIIQKWTPILFTQDKGLKITHT